MRTHAIALSLAALLGPAAALYDAASSLLQAPPSKAIVVEGGFQLPESAIHDAIRDEYLVSNINGGAGDADDNGFISRVSPDGRILELKWISGTDPEVVLNAPKGMAIRGDALIVADIDQVRVFDRTTGRPRGSWPVPDAQFLNDVAVGPDGTVWATDTAISLAGGNVQPVGTAAIYQFNTPGRPEVAARGPELQGPNGIVVGKEGPIFVTFLAREITRLNGPERIHDPMMIVTLPKGQLDGLVQLPDGTFLVSSWEAEGVYRASRTLEPVLIASGLTSPADIGFDAKRARVLIPLLMKNALQILPLPA